VFVWPRSSTSLTSQRARFENATKRTLGWLTSAPCSHWSQSLKFGPRTWGGVLNRNTFDIYFHQKHTLQIKHSNRLKLYFNRKHTPTLQIRHSNRSELLKNLHTPRRDSNLRAFVPVAEAMPVILQPGKGGRFVPFLFNGVLFVLFVLCIMYYGVLFATEYEYLCLWVKFHLFTQVIHIIVGKVAGSN
jgi:hypothetical protein